MSKARDLIVESSRNREGPQRQQGGPTPWYVRFVAVASERSAKIRARYQQQASSGQIVGAGADTYATRLQAGWHRATQPRNDPITQVEQTPSIMPQWPDQPGYKETPLDRTFKMDPRPLVPGHMRPMYRPRPENYRRIYSETGQYAADYLPQRPGFNVVPPMRIPRMHRDGLALMAGACQFGTRQTWGQGESSGVLPPVQMTLGAKSRGVRSIRGVLGGIRQGSGRERIPGVFTPTSIQ
jgi:hypothetical protein